jgi:hypothetical protein
MTFLDAAVAVLKRSNRPLSSAEITERALVSGQLETSGKTPEASMTAALYKEANADRPRVRKISEPGATRAARGSVRWRLVDPQPGDQGEAG